MSATTKPEKWTTGMTTRLVADVTHTAAFLAEPESSSSSIRNVPRGQLLDAPLLSAEGPAPSPAAALSHGTISEAICVAIAKLGENIVLQRVAAVAHEPAPPWAE